MMRRQPSFSSLAFALTVILLGGQEDSLGSSPTRGGLGGEVFERARKEGRFVILDLHAVWCHWCHVMDATTYADPEVKQLIGERFLLVKVDQDSDVELANRYEDYGWPATIVFAADGSEIVRKQGYIPPRRMASMLKAIIEDPAPGPSVVEAETADRGKDYKRQDYTGLDAQTRADVERTVLDRYDEEHAGWGRVHKFLHADTMEYVLSKSREDQDPRFARMAKATLEANLALLDPVFGGVYQYSDRRIPNAPWASPHYEKIMSMQAQNLRLYAFAYVRFGDPKHRAAAASIARYLEEMLMSRDGTFFVSQDADLSADVAADPSAGVDGRTYFSLQGPRRRKLGIPSVDRSVYPRENGWAIRALLSLYDATDDLHLLELAERAAERISADHRSSDGTFVRGQIRFLGDSVAMGEALLALYASTAEPRWLEAAAGTADGIDRWFQHGDAGFVTAPPKKGAPGVGVLRKPVRTLDENIAVARFANLVFRHTGETRHRKMAEHAMRYLASSSGPHLESGRFLAGVLLADEELGREPLHLTVVGPKRDPIARALHRAVRSVGGSYRRIEWWDPSDPTSLPPANLQVSLPKVSRPSVFACSGASCSRPITDPAGVATSIARLSIHRP